MGRGPPRRAHIISQWPANAVKVVTKDQLPADQWTHIAIAYDGTKKAAGVHVYVNGKAQSTNVQSDTLTIHSHDRSVQDRPAK